MDPQENSNLDLIARKIRRWVLTMSHEAKAPHLASALSAVDLIVAAYWAVFDVSYPEDPNRDRVLLSKGHGCSALYAALALKGFIPEEELHQFCKPGSRLPEHPRPKSIPGLEAATGSLGHGLSIGVGMAMAAKLQSKSYRTCVIQSDGECNEGSVWEAAMMAPKQGLDNLITMIDFNKWQATGRSEEVLQLSPLAEKWRAFGWEAREVDGHSYGELIDAMKTPADRPIAIIAHTVKGKGVSFMEDDNNWHYRTPSREELERAFEELPL